MFKVIKRTADTFSNGSEVIGRFETFEEAHAFAVENVCEDNQHEGHIECGHYWFTKDTDRDPSKSYDVHIEKINN